MIRSDERGVALLTVLLLVAVMSALAVGVLDDIRFSLRRATNAQALSQARWYALGAEAMARPRLTQLASEDVPPALWNGKVMSFPIETGVLQSRLRDGSTCFNLNSVVDGAGELLRRRELGVAQFITLLQALDVSEGEAETLAAALVDFIDSDELREPGGAEDETYARAAKPYRTAGTLLAEVSELRAVRGFTPGIYAQLRPLVCALSTPRLSPINVNALQAEQAPLVVMLAGGEISRQAAAQVIAGRPAGGWTDVAAFWRAAPLQEALPPDEVIKEVGVRPRAFLLETEVTYGEVFVSASARFEQDPTGRLFLAARRWTTDE